MTITPPLSWAPRAQLSPDISLGEVLAGFGHDCLGSCASAGEELRAPVWFVHRRAPRDNRADHTLVVLDASEYDGPPARSRQLLRAVNDCVRPDGIRVTERRIDDSGHALAAVSRLDRLQAEDPSPSPGSAISAASS